MRRISTLLLTVTMFAVPLSAQAQEAKAKETKTATAKSGKRKTASKPQKGAITVDKLKQEVAGRIAHEREQAEQTAGKATGKNSPARKLLEGAVSQVKAKLASATQDGTVTKDELKNVRESYKLMAVKQANSGKTAKKSKR